MEQYFNFTPYVTDTPVSFTITDGSFMDFICEQLTAANIPFTKNVHMYKINDGGPIEGTEFIMHPSQAFSYAIITAPLTKSMVNRLMANNDHKTFNADSIGPIEGTEFIMHPSQAFSYAIITAPLTKSMVNRLMANNDHKTFNADSIMKNAYIA